MKMCLLFHEVVVRVRVCKVGALATCGLHFSIPVGTARIGEVESDVFDLFVQLDATESQLGTRGTSPPLAA